MSALQGVSPSLSVSECDDICPALRDTVDLFISEAMRPILNKLKSITKTLMYWKLPIP